MSSDTDPWVVTTRVDRDNPPLVLKPAWAWWREQNLSAKPVEVAKPVRMDVQRAAVRGGIAVSALYPRDAGSRLRTGLTSADLALVFHGRDARLLLPVVSCCHVCSCGGVWYFDIVFSSGKEDWFLSLIYPRYSLRFLLFLKSYSFPSVKPQM